MKGAPGGAAQPSGVGARSGRVFSSATLVAGGPVVVHGSPDLARRHRGWAHLDHERVVGGRGALWRRSRATSDPR